ncbi:hypothetical protein C8Q70DRAFT_641495 [Cubamyces menziesii]|nr:hypothetical protein C8Q70DRAFT_641495 [Cubamyces menziesii]
MRTPLAALLFRDGTVYFLFTLMAQLPILVPTPDQYAAIWAIWQGVAPVFTNIAVARLILNLRGVYFADSTGGEGETSLHLSSMRFRGLSSANIVGNLGATLMLPSNSAELTGIPFDARRPSDNARSRSGPAQPDEMSASEAVDINDAWDLEDETPEYCDDPFLRGMREAVTADSTGEIMMPLSHC